MIDDMYTEVHSKKVHYIESGNGKPFLLFHGARFNARTWEETGTIDALSGAGFRAISVDFPGFGKSDRSDQNLPDFINEFIDAMGLEKPIVLGASMGGEAVLGFSVKYENYSGIVLVGAVGVSQYENELNKISGKPFLLIWGKNDMVSSPANYQMLMKYNKDAKFINVGYQHACYLDDNKSFNNEIVNFAKSL
ncbi:alpha/beta fold hydrolase [Picrophilus oshimae]|uniref:Alpha/beta hydrolase family protein n=1 Tax=Picrophilus torridus (strain ATCC 700027 / DSM 9790 / JCM 10055 / NBRC 100828 / KAW 2/3) TaxID=1122961 RepID=Q6L0C9_PICTO|nr:alpha/beta hydrolase [Picrophilus oshimae]AAT43573.1 carboxylesterase [Picrophilus oshimae DSM 9789]SMD31197.1 Alpha/beta hydrolase family protein [Picrophilus oshimae DSM 9789]